MAQIIYLQMGLLLVFLAVFNSISAPSSDSSHLLIKTNQFFIYSGFFPWGFYLLLALSLAFSTQKLQLPIIRSSLWPIYKNKLESIFGLGIDLYIKQGILLSVAAALGFLAVDFTQKILNFFTHQTLNPFAILLTSTLFFLLLSSSFSRRFSRYFWSKQFSPALLILIFLLIFSVLTLFSYLIVSILSLFVPPPPLDLLKITLLGAHFSEWLDWILLLLTLEILSAPLIAFLFREHFQGLSIRSSICYFSLLPVTIGLLGILDYFYFNNFFANGISQILKINGLGLMLDVLGIFFILSVFQFPENIDLVRLTQKKQGNRPSLLAIRNFLFILSAICFIFMLIGAHFILLYISSCLLGVFFILLASCLSLLKSLK